MAGCAKGARGDAHLQGEPEERTVKVAGLDLGEGLSPSHR
jgi:hypothetical protein